MNAINDVCVMDDGRDGFAVYYRFASVTTLGTQAWDAWHLFATGYDRAGATRQADQLLGQTWDVLADGPGEGIDCGSYFGAFNAPFVYRNHV
jgi:hypothetical protein